jgi:hypothetical protein
MDHAGGDLLWRKFHAAAAFVRAKGLASRDESMLARSHALLAASQQLLAQTLWTDATVPDWRAAGSRPGATDRRAAEATPTNAGLVPRNV